MTRYRLDVGFRTVIHPHHVFLDNRYGLLELQSREERLVRWPATGVGRGAIETVGSWHHSFQLLVVAVGTEVGDPGEVEAQEKG